MHVARLGVVQKIILTIILRFIAPYLSLSLFSAGPKVKNISDLSEVNRFTEPPLTGPFCDLLWSDPLLEHVLGYQLSDLEFSEVKLTQSRNYFSII